ncbi:Hypothetical predicted protein [Octopus vulgaris]|uniref:Uncharacterized protein n=1 Tax=Octopus vulgaris TaxID=6645 RepID=A0AA36AWY8_OCTVU|nr:Hypothetical predicted protein [Octopus vulgaris]
MHLLDAEIKKRFPKVAPTHWNLNHSLAETFREYHEQLADLFLNITDKSTLLDPMRQNNNIQKTSVTCLKHSYEDYFDSQKLRSELTALYKDAELKGKSIQDLLYILHNSGLDETAPVNEAL